MSFSFKVEVENKVIAVWLKVLPKPYQKKSFFYIDSIIILQHSFLREPEILNINFKFKIFMAQVSDEGLNCT